jgi:hypothetical protein
MDNSVERWKLTKGSLASGTVLCQSGSAAVHVNNNVVESHDDEERLLLVEYCRRHGRGTLCTEEELTVRAVL